MNAPRNEPSVTMSVRPDGAPGGRVTRGARLVWTALAIILALELGAMVWFSRTLIRPPKPKANPVAAPSAEVPGK